MALDIVSKENSAPSANKSVARGEARRQHLVTVALGLFSQYGFHATGIDRILTEAGVSKKTMYHHFRSKEELILAVLRHYDSLFRNNFIKQVEQRATTPEQKLLSLFEVAQEWFINPEFCGCLFTKAAGEYALIDQAIYNMCREFKRLLHSYIRQLCADLPKASPDQLADQIALLLEGAIVTAQVSQKPEAALTAQAIVKQLLAAR